MAEDVVLKISADVKAAETEVTRLLKKVEEGGTLSAKEMARLALSLDKVEQEINQTSGAAGKYDAQLKTLRGSVQQLTAAEQKQIAALDDVQKRRAAARQDLGDLGRSLGLPIGQLGLMSVALVALSKDLQEGKKDLAEIGKELKEEATALGLSEAATARVDSALNSLMSPLGTVKNVFNQISLSGRQAGEMWAAFNDIVSETPAIVSQASEAEKQLLNDVRALVKARDDRKAAIDRDVAALNALIEEEREHGGVTQETIKAAQDLEKKYGKDLPAAFGETITALGMTTAEMEKQRDAAKVLAQQGFDELTKRIDGTIERFTTTTKALDEQTFEIMESVGHLKLLGTVTKEEGDKVVASLLEQLEAYRQVGDEAPPELQALLEEWVDLEKQTEAGGEATKESVGKMVAAYKEAGEKIPDWLQDIVDGLGLVDEELKALEEGARRFADQFRTPIEELDAAVMDTVNGIALLRDEGVLTGEVAAAALEDVVAQMNEWRRQGLAVPPILQDIAYELGFIVRDEMERLAQINEQNVAYEAQLQLLMDAQSILDRAVQTGKEFKSLFEPFEGLPDDVGQAADDMGRLADNAERGAEAFNPSTGGRSTGGGAGAGTGNLGGRVDKGGLGNTDPFGFRLFSRGVGFAGSLEDIRKRNSSRAPGGSTFAGETGATPSANQGKTALELQLERQAEQMGRAQVAFTNMLDRSFKAQQSPEWVNRPTAGDRAVLVELQGIRRALDGHGLGVRTGANR